MTRYFLVLAIFAAGSLWSVPGEVDAASPAPLELEVHVSPDHASDFLSLKIKLSIKDQKRQGLQLEWPVDYFGSDVGSHIRNARVEGVEGNDITFVTESNRFISSLLIPTTPDGTIIIRYEFDPNGIEGDRAWHPAVDDNHLHFMGHTVLPRLCLEAECDGQKMITARFDWSAYGGHAWTTWSPDRDESMYHGPMQGLLEAIYAVGTFDQQLISVGSNLGPDLPVTLVTHGLSTDERQGAAQAIQSAMAGVVSFWRESPANHYLVTLRKAKGEQDHDAYSGFDANDSFALMSKGGDLINDHAFKTLVAHEFTHRWIDSELFANPRGNRMFHEGFTEFVARQVIWRQGLMPFDDYRKEINEVLESYFSSWLHDAPEADLAEFNGKAVSYERGELLALSWAHQLAHRVDNNKNLMTQEAFENFDLPIDRFIRAVIASTNGDGTLNPEDAFEIAHEFGVTSIQEDIEALSGGDGAIDVANWFSPCSELTSKTVERPEIGLNIFESFREGVISELDPNGPAARAGLQGGDRVRHLSFKGLSESTWEVEREGQRLKFTYPNESKMVTVPQFQAKIGAAQDGLCLGKEG